MGTRERDIINRRLSSLDANTRLFRINAGTGWTGEYTRHGDILVIKNPRPFHAAPDGWADLCGWQTVEITPDMVGQKIAVFVMEEVKATGRLSPAQERFREIVERMGGVYRVINH